MGCYKLILHVNINGTCIVRDVTIQNKENYKQITIYKYETTEHFYAQQNILLNLHLAKKRILNKRTMIAPKGSTFK